MPIALFHIIRILLLRARFKVRGIAASPVITRVPYLQPVGQLRARDEFVHEPIWNVILASVAPVWRAVSLVVISGV